ncbi:hypothetical protein BJV77DRAFT_980032 [Russula vinacea]|nr:hypothetical protein BJV77DRAFT_980032 [Russula vinacea]
MVSQCDIDLGYTFLIIGSVDAGVRGIVSSYMEEAAPSRPPMSFLRANQKPMRLGDNRDIFRECYGDLARSHGILLVYNPTSPISFQYIVGFHEQLIRSKWRSLPVVLLSNTSAQPHVDSIKGTQGRDLANTYSIPFIEASPGHPCPAPFPTLLSLVRQYYEASTSKSFGEGVIDFFTVAAARVSHVTRPHLSASPVASKEPMEYPPRAKRYNLPVSFSAPRCGSFFLPRSWHFPCIPRFRPARNFRQ